MIYLAFIGIKYIFSHPILLVSLVISCVFYVYYKIKEHKEKKRFSRRRIYDAHKNSNVFFENHEDKKLPMFVSWEKHDFPSYSLENDTEARVITVGVQNYNRIPYVFFIYSDKNQINVLNNRNWYKRLDGNNYHEIGIKGPKGPELKKPIRIIDEYRNVKVGS
jgi:uncharacterized DUF497 family protein